ncbi:predicted protein [Chaetomium globosum CBS 148.51]|uniref:Uncharacterized protein n=1 Tax=Chaetomium globosum (strain ATCC 6205 / CBS 148.51 / DSM 1962 / NBRC 6347 / NRRL 1970) TaxID=306901 RepID=Q2H5L7_CHAGB|nr:uncharacterized protein CHGG_06048 [Chaetomium globosum CBS 148.51]EAQ89429.1 predicted protein [Chaetomium globosum CBS 148.51]
MGIDRDTRPADKKFHKFRRDDQLRRYLTSRQQSHIARVINGHPGGGRPRLRAILPTVGLIWPFKAFMVGDSDEKVTTALRKITPHLSEERVENCFSQMFLEATKEISRPTHPPNGKVDFIVFIRILQGINMSSAGPKVSASQIREYEGRYPVDVVMPECPVAQAGPPRVPTGRVNRDNDVDMMADGIRDLAIEQSYKEGTGGGGSADGDVICGGMADRDVITYM